MPEFSNEDIDTAVRLRACLQYLPKNLLLVESEKIKDVARRICEEFEDGDTALLRTEEDCYGYVIQYIRMYQKIIKKIEKLQAEEGTYTKQLVPTHARPVRTKEKYGHKSK